VRPKLITRAPSRFFAFGCSFTQHRWPTWADIVGHELGLTVNNFGRGGSSNQYAFNKLMQADNYFQINENDLVIICWTSVAREDRYLDGRWYTPGNIYSQNTYDEKYIKKWADPMYYLLRDYAIIKAVKEFLEKRQCQYHFLKMCDFDLMDTWNNTDKFNNHTLTENYSDVLASVQKSFFEVLWNNDLSYKRKMEKLIHPKLDDGHPMPIEALTYLQTVFDHDFNDATKETVNRSQSTVIKLIQDFLDVNPRERYFDDFFKKDEAIWPTLTPESHGTFSNITIY